MTHRAKAVFCSFLAFHKKTICKCLPGHAVPGSHFFSFALKANLKQNKTGFSVAIILWLKLNALKQLTRPSFDPTLA